MSPVSNTSSVAIFISHSHKDAGLAHRLIKLLNLATGINPSLIRCSSVPGHQLPGGVLIDTLVRSEILTAPVFIALLTRESLKSTYVLLEIGARWGFGVQSGTDYKLIPLLAAGMQANELKDPLSRLTARSCDKESDLRQLVQEICSELGLSPRSYDHYVDEIEELQKQSNGGREYLPPDPKRETMKICLRKAWWEHNKKRNWKRIDKMADHCRISEAEALRLLQSMSDMIVSNTPDGHKITKKKF